MGDRPARMSPVTQRFLIVRATIALGMLAGIALSMPLWRTRDSFPRVPLLDFIPAMPAPFDVGVLLALARIPTLNTLSVASTQITQKGIVDLQTLRPDLQISW